MNIINTMKARIEKSLTETKSPCKVYKTEARAEQATALVALHAATHFLNEPQPHDSANYVVFEVEGFGWVGCVNITELLGRNNACGGYLGFCTGFFTW